MQSVTFQVPGKPQGKARARTVYNAHLKHCVSYTPENDLLYENLIKTMYMQVSNGIRFEKETPVTLRIIARFESPKSASKKRQQQMLSGDIEQLRKIYFPIAESWKLIREFCDATGTPVECFKVHERAQDIYERSDKTQFATEIVSATVNLIDRLMRENGGTAKEWRK